ALADILGQPGNVVLGVVEQVRPRRRVDQVDTNHATHWLPPFRLPRKIQTDLAARKSLWSLGRARGRKPLWPAPLRGFGQVPCQRPLVRRGPVRRERRAQRLAERLGERRQLGTRRGPGPLLQPVALTADAEYATCGGCRDAVPAPEHQHLGGHGMRVLILPSRHDKFPCCGGTMNRQVESMRPKRPWQERRLMAADWKAQMEWSARGQLGGSNAKAARAMGVSGEQMRLYLKGAKPGPEVLASLLAKKPHISARYLLTGEGPRTVKPIDSDLYAAGQRDVARAVLRRLTA